jgi:hypothetical protein
MRSRARLADRPYTAARRLQSGRARAVARRRRSPRAAGGGVVGCFRTCLHGAAVPMRGRSGLAAAVAAAAAARRRARAAAARGGGGPGSLSANTLRVFECSSFRGQGHPPALTGMAG